MISWNEALDLVKNTNKLRHSLTVANMMEALAERLGENVEEWRLVGLLHDLDYDEVKNDMSRHGLVAAEILKDKLPERLVHAIKAHDYRSGVKPESKIDRMLVAADTTANLIERIGKTARELTVPTLREAIKNRSGTQPWYKNNVLLCKHAELRVDDFLEMCLNAAKKNDSLAF